MSVPPSRASELHTSWRIPFTPPVPSGALPAGVSHSSLCCRSCPPLSPDSLAHPVHITCAFRGAACTGVRLLPLLLQVMSVLVTRHLGTLRSHHLRLQGICFHACLMSPSAVGPVCPLHQTSWHQRLPAGCRIAPSAAGRDFLPLITLAHSMRTACALRKAAFTHL